MIRVIGCSKTSIKIMKKCQHNTNKCPGHYETNLCGGPNPRKCCVEGSAPDCRLEVYENTHIKGYNGLTVQVDEEFVPYMDDMNDIAKGLGLFFFQNLPSLILKNSI